MYSKYSLPSPQLMLTPIEHTILCKRKKGMSSDLISIGFRTCARNHADYYPLTVIKHIMNGFSGKLFTLLRTNHGLTYRSSCDLEFHEHTGYLEINIQSDPEKIMNTKEHRGVIPLVIQMLNKMKRGISETELRIAKGNIKGSYLLNQQDDENIVEHNGRGVLFNEKIIPYHDVYKKCILKLTVSRIEEVIRKYIGINNMIFGIMFHKEIPKKELEYICRQLTLTTQ